MEALDPLEEEVLDLLEVEVLAHPEEALDPLMVIQEGGVITPEE